MIIGDRLFLLFAFLVICLLLDFVYKTLVPLSDDIVTGCCCPQMGRKKSMLPSFRRYLLGCAALVSVLAPSFASSVQAAEWYFYVKNDSNSAITRLEAKEKGGSWLKFDLNGGIRAGKKVRIDWAASTNYDDCKQFIRATFADGSVTSPTLFDFCNDLDAPIVFD